MRRLPAVGAVIEALRDRDEGARGIDAELLTYLTRGVLARYRTELLAPGNGAEPPTLDDAANEVGLAFRAWRRSSTCRIVNATGIILHSGLGRAVLAPEVIAEVAGADGYVLLEVDREEGRRRKRDAFCEELLCELTGAEAALVVNNNAAATMIVLNSLAAGREVVVSRSQMVEIGGSFRLPDVMAMSGCRLREVGTTNRSYARDYEGAVTDETGALMLVHTSNYRIAGFTRHVEIDEMVEIGRRVDRPVYHDLGSGSLVDLVPWGITDEPHIAASLKAGADVVSFSGDKLIGGPQAGIIVGRKAWIERIRKNPLARALRIDKLTCIALEATLKLYLEPSTLTERIPTLAMLSRPLDSVRAEAEELAARLRDALPEDAARVGVVDETSEMGAGTLPTQGIPTACVALRLEGTASSTAARRLRVRPLPVFARVKDEQILFDARTLRPGDQDHIVEAVVEVASA